MGRRLLLPTAAMLFLAACGGSVRTPVPVCAVAQEPFEIRIKGFGALEAAKATPIEVPQILRGSQRIVSLAKDGAKVEEGDLIARLDGIYLRRRTQRSKDAIRRLDRQLEAKRKALEKERKSVEAQVALLEQEKRDAEKFAPRDEELFSRHEILDAQVDLELLDTKIEFAKSKLERYTQRAEAEMEILRLQKQTQQVRLSQFEKAMVALEVRAPHGGFFYRGRNWQGNVVREGNIVYSGMELGELPDLSRMEAKVHILESEAAGLAEDLRVAVTLDAHPGMRFEGTVSSVQAIANPIDEESPVKYFEVKIALDRTDTVVMKPRSQVQAAIYVTREDEVVSVPNQAIFHKGDETWVWVSRGRGFEKRPVSIGSRSLSRTVVTEGLNPGEQVALADPDAAEETG